MTHRLNTFLVFSGAQEVLVRSPFPFSCYWPVCLVKLYRYQVEAIRRGLGTVIPCKLLRLFSWEEVEVLVCGKKEVDIDLLEACTEYSMCDREDAHVSAFWEVLRSFSPKEKSLFLRCVRI